MATTTPNFGWPVPTSTDLVKDGATAIEALGDSIDASLLDLKGGTTGQVLSKNTNTDMDFTWVAANPGDITGVTAGTGISGGGTSGTVTITNSMATEITAKGDLIVGTGSATFDNLAAGSNGDTLVADSSTSTGLRYQSAYNGNAIINGGLDIWQRGTSFAAPTNNTFVADRWAWSSSSVASKTVSRQSSGLTGFQYSIRVARDSGNTNTAANYIGYSMETSDAIRFAGQTITFSFYAKAGANYSPTSSLLGYRLGSGTGTDQNFLTGGYTGNVNLLDNTQAITTTWTRYSFTTTVGSTATELGLFFYATPTGTAGANDWYEITGVQVELGSVATTFKRSNGSGGTIQGELAACQRYYFKIGAEGNAYTAFGNAASTGANGTDLITVFPVSMRTQPAAVEASAASTFSAGAVTGLTGVTYNSATNSKAAYTLFQKTGGFTALGAYPISANNSTAAYLAWSAEL